MDRVPVCRAQRTATSLASPILRNRRGGLFSHTSQELRFFSLAACPPNNRRKAKKYPTWSSRAPKTSRICLFNARETLWRDIQPSRRHGGVGVVRPDYSKTITYELCARPDADPSKIFGCVIKADHDTDKLAFLMDDYAQYRFKNQIEEPFLEILQKTTDLRGAARSSRISPCPIAIGVSTTSTTT